MTARRLEKNPLHLGLGARALPEPDFDGSMGWYGDYAERHAADGIEGRLVSLHGFSASWEMWEMHPNGDEMVLCTAGVLLLAQEQADGGVQRTRLEAGEYAINPAGVWHTADVEGAASAVFITAGVGTQHRPRE